MRLSDRKIATDDVQGPGSYVVIRGMTVGDVLGLAKAQEQQRGLVYRASVFVGRLLGLVLGVLFPSLVPWAQSRQQRETVRVLLRNVVEWSWTDSTGKPLDLADPDLVDKLSMREFVTLRDAVFQQSEQSKN